MASLDRYFAKLAGRLRFVDALVPVEPLGKPSAAAKARQKAFIGPSAPRLIYINVPLAWQRTVTEQDLAELQSVAEAKQAIRFSAASSSITTRRKPSKARVRQFHGLTH